MGEADNGRTHEPTLRELTAELDGLRDLMVSEVKGLRAIVDERDKLYKERSDAAKEQVGIAFTASEKAANKTEQAQDLYNRGHNDLIRKMDEQHKETIPKDEANAKFDSLAKEIQSLRESRVESSSSTQQSARDMLDAQRRKTNSDRTTLAIVGILITLAITGLNFLTRTSPATPTPAVVVTPAPTTTR